MRVFTVLTAISESPLYSVSVFSLFIENEAAWRPEYGVVERDCRKEMQKTYSSRHGS